MNGMTPDSGSNRSKEAAPGARVLDGLKKLVGVASSIYALLHGLEWGSRSIMIALLCVAGLIAIDELRRIAWGKKTPTPAVSESARRQRRIARRGAVVGIVLVVVASVAAAWILPGGLDIEMMAALPTDEQLETWSLEMDAVLIQYIEDKVLPHDEEIEDGTAWESLDPALQEAYLADAREALEQKDPQVVSYYRRTHGETGNASPFELVLKIKSSYSRPLEVWIAEVVVYNGQCLQGCVSAGPEETQIPDPHVLRYSATLDPTLGVSEEGCVVRCNEFETQHLASRSTSDLHLTLRNETYGTENIAFGLYEIEVRLLLSNGRTVTSERMRIAVPALLRWVGLVDSTTLDSWVRFRATDPCCRNNYCALAAFDRSSNVLRQDRFLDFEKTVERIETESGKEPPNVRFADVAMPDYCQSPSSCAGK